MKKMCSANQETFLDEITMEIHRLSVTSFIKLQNNATSCFNRMIVSLTTLCYRIFEVKDHFGNFQANTLLKMIYYNIRNIKTNIQKMKGNSNSWIRSQIGCSNIFL